MKKKQWIRAAAFLALLAAAFALLSPVFTPKDELGNIQEEPANSLDYLAIGDSECYTSISPMQLWGDYGYVGYNCGLASQRIQDAYYRLKKTLECQTPRLVLLETNMLFRNKGVRQETVTGFDHAFGNLVGLYQYHNTWKSLFRQNRASGKAEWLKGLRYRPDCRPYTGGPYVEKTEKVQPVAAAQRFWLDRILALCRKKHIRLVLYTVPSPLCWSYAKHNGAEAYAKSHGLTLLDLNLQLDKVGIDWSKDTWDRGNHLNFSGAQKLTAYLGQWLREKGWLPDRRGEQAYAAWDREMALYLTGTGGTMQKAGGKGH